MTCHLKLAKHLKASDILPTIPADKELRVAAQNALHNVEQFVTDMTQEAKDSWDVEFKDAGELFNWKSDDS